ncbi:MAG: acetylserotonin O-methyltransferase [Kiritimatiellaeota bacterium]|nr:acetylserotonin O-methyltransferase [Kiritimatiellota bacterium]
MKTLSDIIDLASAYYGSSVLFAATERDVFTAVEEAGGEATAERIAGGRSLDARATRLLLDACVAIGLLEKSGEVYRNTPAGRLALVAGSPQDLRGAIAYNRDVYPAWGRLSEFLRTGAPVESPAIHLGDDAARTRAFALAMHGRALGIGRSVIPFLDLSGRSHLLDLAGGPGTYARLMAEANPQLTIDTYDLPAIAEVARELIAPTAVADRVHCHAGDYHTHAYPASHYDAVTIFGALHQESPDDIVAILRRAAAALRPGGRIYVLDMMTDATHASPPFSALFAVNMALTAHNGWVFSDSELYGWLGQAGFCDCATRPLPPPMPHWLVTASK